MISFYVRGQELRVSASVIAADTLNYLTARFAFNADWNGLTKIAHFSNGTNAADVELTDDEILASDGLNLGAGTWQVAVTGHAMSGGELTQRITTTVAEFVVQPSGVPSGEPIPSLPSYGEEILAEVEEIEQALGVVKNVRDNSFLRVWAGTQAQFDDAEKNADTIYLIDMGLTGSLPSGGGE